MPILQLALIEIAQEQVGIREEGGNNQGEDIIKYLRSSWMPEESNRLGYAWCGVFVGWCVREACIKVDIDPKEFHYLGADAYGWEKHAKKKGWEILPDTGLALPGDLVTFDFSHIGIVIEDKRDTIDTVEGNTNGKGDRDSESGDGVWSKNRVKSLAKSFIRLPGAYQ
jgi:hypothetical protein